MIRTDHLHKKYARQEALHDLTVDVPEGSVFALVGPNGAGKTTAIKTLMNIFEPTSGRAEVLGVESRKLGAEQFAQIGYVSENQKLPDWMRVGYFFSFCKRFYSTWHDADLAELVSTYELPLDRPLKALSRGMRMKAALAASLAYRPRLIVLESRSAGSMFWCASSSSKAFWNGHPRLRCFSLLTTWQKSRASLPTLLT